MKESHDPGDLGTTKVPVVAGEAAAGRETFDPANTGHYPPRAQMNPSKTDAAEIDLSNLQGNILKGHGRKYSALVFFRFGADHELNRMLLRAAANPNGGHPVTTAAQQGIDAAKYREAKVSGSAGKGNGVDPLDDERLPFRSLLLTSAGLRHLIFAREEIDPQRERESFWVGMENAVLGDPEKWEDDYLLPPHGAWLLANASEARREEMIVECEAWLNKPYGATVLRKERGFRWDPCDHAISHEPFGFADGFMSIKIGTRMSTGLFGWLRRKIERWRFDAAQGMVLPVEQIIIQEPDPLAGSSFMVFRKLDQNVRAFARAEADLTRQIEGMQPPARPRCRDAGALFIGRERDGTPLINGGLPHMTDFDFEGDKTGSGCPFHAHIRKMNPRQDFDHLGNRVAPRKEDQMRRQFIRRGVVYGDEDRLKLRWRNPQNAPDGGVGLLFMGYMSDIGGQFLEIHRQWALVDSFPSGRKNGKDPIFQRQAGPVWQWPAGSLQVQFSARLVTPLGGAFFLVPCLSWLKRA